MGINGLQAFRFSYGDVVITHSDYFAVLLVRIIDPSELFAIPRPQGQPDIREFCKEWSWNMLEVLIRCEIWQHVIKNKPNWCEYCRDDEILLECHCYWYENLQCRLSAAYRKTYTTAYLREAHDTQLSYTRLRDIGGSGPLLLCISLYNEVREMWCEVAHGVSSSLVPAPTFACLQGHAYLEHLTYLSTISVMICTDRYEPIGISAGVWNAMQRVLMLCDTITSTRAYGRIQLGHFTSTHNATSTNTSSYRLLEYLYATYASGKV